MAVARQGADGVPDVGRNDLPGFPLGNHLVHLRLGRDIAGQQKKPEGLDGRIVGFGGLWQCRESLGNGLATETDPFLRIQVRDVGDQGLNVAGAADRLRNGHVADFYFAEFLDQAGGAGTVFLNLVSQDLLECRHALSPLMECNSMNRNSPSAELLSKTLIEITSWYAVKPLPGPARKKG